MDVKIEKQESSKVVLEFTMAKDEFEKALDKAFIKNSKYFKVPGFRAGKVPRNVVEKMYGPGVLYEAVINDTVDVDYKKAVEENNLEVVSEPKLDVKQVEKGKELIYTVTFFVKPEVTVKKYKGLEIEKIDTKVNKADIDQAIDSDREKNARTVTIEDRKLQDKDISTIDFEGFVDGIAFEGGKGESFELTIGSGQFIPGFEEQLIGMEIGEEREINVKFPDEYHSENLAGKDSIFKVKLISIKSKILPDLDDEFAKDISEFANLEDYRKDVETKVKEKKEKQAKIEKENKCIEKLLENVEVEIPESMIENSIDQMVEQFSSNLMYQGMNLETYCGYLGTTVEEFRNNMKPEAEKDVKFKLALEAVAKTEDVKIEDAEIDKAVEDLATSYKNENADSLKANQNVRNYMKEKLLQEKTLEIIVNNAVEK